METQKIENGFCEMEEHGWTLDEDSNGNVVLRMTKHTAELVVSALDIIEPDEPELEEYAQAMVAGMRGVLDPS